MVLEPALPEASLPGFKKYFSRSNATGSNVFTLSLRGVDLDEILVVNPQVHLLDVFVSNVQSYASELSISHEIVKIQLDIMNEMYDLLGKLFFHGGILVGNRDYDNQSQMQPLDYFGRLSDEFADKFWYIKFQDLIKYPSLLDIEESVQDKLPVIGNHGTRGRTGYAAYFPSNSDSCLHYILKKGKKVSNVYPLTETHLLLLNERYKWLLSTQGISTDSLFMTTNLSLKLMLLKYANSEGMGPVSLDTAKKIKLQKYHPLLQGARRRELK